MPKGTILIVDDDEELASELRGQLRDYSVETASNVTAARDLFETRLFDCILLDVQFPDGPHAGLDLLKHIKGQSERTQTKTVILSGIMDDDDVAVALRQQADEVLKKPVGIKELRARIARLITKLPIDDPHLRLDIAAGAATFDGRPMDLTKQQFQALRWFFEHGKGTDLELAGCLLDPNRRQKENEAAAVKTAVWRLRERLREYSSHEYIRRYRASFQAAGGYEFVTAPQAKAEPSVFGDVLARWRSPEGLKWKSVVHQLSHDVMLMSWSLAGVREELGKASVSVDRLEEPLKRLETILRALQKEHL